MPQGIDLEDSISKSKPWSMKSIQNFNGGLNGLVRPEDVADDELVVALNIRSEKNRTLTDYGYGTFGQVVRGNPRRSYQFFLKDGSSFQCLITDDTFYTWSTGVTEWHLVSDGVDTTVAIAGSATDLTITVADDTGFSDDDYIGILLDDGTQHQTRVNGAPAANVITFDDALPSGTAIGKTVVKSVDLSGVTTEYVSVTTVASHDWMLFANGGDVLQRFDGSTVEDVPDMPAGLTSVSMVHQFGDYTIMLGMTESGNALPQRVRVSDTGRPDIWTSGNATFYELYGTPGYITNVANLGPYMMVYKDRSIIRFEFVGSDEQLLSFETVVNGEGAISRGALVNLGDQHIFIGHRNIYEYQGGFDYKELGDKIRHKTFGTAGEINPSVVSAVFLIHVEPLREVWFFYPHGANTKPKRFLRYHLDQKSFLQRDLSIEVTGYGDYISAASRKWNDLTGTWIEQDWVWSSQLLLASSATIHIGAGDLQVYEYDYFVSTDNGVDISFQLETRDFFLVDKKARFDRVDLKIKGTDVLVEYSVDEGASWIEWGTVASSASFSGVVQLWKQVVSDVIRFKITSSGGGFGIETFAFRFKPETMILE